MFIRNVKMRKINHCRSWNSRKDDDCTVRIARSRSWSATGFYDILCCSMDYDWNTRQRASLSLHTLPMCCRLSSSSPYRQSEITIRSAFFMVYSNSLPFSYSTLLLSHSRARRAERFLERAWLAVWEWMGEAGGMEWSSLQSHSMREDWWGASQEVTCLAVLGRSYSVSYGIGIIIAADASYFLEVIPQLDLICGVSTIATFSKDVQLLSAHSPKNTFCQCSIKEPNRHPSTRIPLLSEVVSRSRLCPLPLNSPSMVSLLTSSCSTLTATACNILSIPNTTIRSSCKQPHLGQKGMSQSFTFFHIPPGRSVDSAFQMTSLASKIQAVLVTTASLSSPRDMASVWGWAGGAYIANSFFHCQVERLRAQRSFRCFAGAIWLPPYSIRHGPMQAVTGFQRRLGNLPFVYCVLHCALAISKMCTFQTVAAAGTLALKANFFLGYYGLSGGRTDAYSSKAGVGIDIQERMKGWVVVGGQGSTLSTFKFIDLNLLQNTFAITRLNSKDERATLGSYIQHQFFAELIISV